MRRALEFLRQTVPIQRWMALALVFASFMIMAQWGWASWEQQKCDEALTSNYAMRFRWLEQDRIAMQQFWIKIAHNPGDRKQNLQAFHEWISTFKTNAEKRQHTDLTPLSVCD